MVAFHWENDNINDVLLETELLRVFRDYYRFGLLTFRFKPDVTSQKPLMMTCVNSCFVETVISHLLLLFLRFNPIALLLLILSIYLCVTSFKRVVDIVRDLLELTLIPTRYSIAWMENMETPVLRKHHDLVIQRPRTIMSRCTQAYNVDLHDL